MNNTAFPSPAHPRAFVLFVVSLGLALFATVSLAHAGTRPFKRTTTIIVSRSVTQRIKPSAEPIQNKLQDDIAPMIWMKEGKTWTITPRAKYRISARVLGKKDYQRDWPAAVIPVDLALAWGALSDPAVDQHIRWRQSGRWYYYRWRKDSPYPQEYIRDHSANVHIIPATENLANVMKKISTNDFVWLEGMLVDIEVRGDSTRHRAVTSLSRQDSGGGACEILYVERLIVNDKVYQ